MASDRQLYRIEQENSALFGLKWSAVGCLLALCFLLSGCALFDSGAVRYNSVVGEKRVPTLNPGGVGFSSTAMGQNQTMVQSYQQTISMTPPPQDLVQQMPVAPAAAAAPAPVAMDGSYPQLPPTAAAQQPLMGNDAAIQAEIATLERDMAATQAQRQQLAAQQQEDSWLPDLGVGDWFGGNSAAATPTAPQPPVAGGYAPVQLPPPGGAPMPPVITQPYQPPTAAEMAAAAPAATGPVDVPLAPDVGAVAPSNVPSSLIPPGASLAPGGGYLEDSRYSDRRTSMRP